MQPVPIIISGAFGRMGESLTRLAQEDEGLKLVGGLESSANVAATKGRLLLKRDSAPLVERIPDLNAPEGSVVIDFSRPDATMQHLGECVAAGYGMVIGTTGLSDGDKQAVRDASARIAVLQAANMSIGINLLSNVVSLLATKLHDNDIEIVEMHHRKKKDAPSGTALLLAEAAAGGRKQLLGDIERHGRHGMVGERPHREIGFHAVRGGDVVGDHTIIFAGEGERIEVTHRAHSRDTFAAGALRAAKFLAEQEKGLFSMKDVLGLS